MKKLFTLLAVALIGAGAAQAVTLTPEQALARVNRVNAPARVRALTAASPALLRTISLPDNVNAPAVYLFGNADGAFMAVAADDRAQALLGYGDRAPQAGEQLPPSFLYWLDCYAREIAAAPEGRVAVPASRADRTPIEPMVTTLWDQAAPYNDLCPTIQGYPTYTGCVATAVAQVMNYHQYPATGQGSNTYTVQSAYGNFSVSLDFSTITFDWANMLDSYKSGNYTPAQAEAVATLMEAAGVMCDMQYGLNSSGATDVFAAVGLIKYLNYSPALHVENRNWYFLSDWEDMIYNELAEGRPVAYGGLTANNEGHEFVCDGYQGDGYFHINWGWSGTSNGYFLLTALDPDVQGSGGAASGYAFNYEQGAMFNFRAPQEGDAVVPVISAVGFSTDRESYTTTSNVQITLMGGFFNLGSAPFDGSFGIKLSAPDKADTYINLYNCRNLAVAAGFSSLAFGSKDLPTGTWKAVPAYKYGGEWYEMKRDLTSVTPLTFTVTSSSVTVSQGEPEVDPDILNVNSTFQGWDTDELVRGNTYTATFDLTANKNSTLTFQPVIMTSTSSILSRATQQEVSLTEGETSTVGFQLRLPATMRADRTYTLQNAYVDDESNALVAVGSPIEFSVLETTGIADVTTEVNAQVIATYDLQGRLVANPVHGIYLQRMSDGTVRRIRIN